MIKLQCGIRITIGKKVRMGRRRRRRRRREVRCHGKGPIGGVPQQYIGVFTAALFWPTIVSTIVFSALGGRLLN